MGQGGYMSRFGRGRAALVSLLALPPCPSRATSSSTAPPTPPTMASTSGAGRHMAASASDHGGGAAMPAIAAAVVAAGSSRPKLRAASGDWVAYLLVSPTRSSLAGVAAVDELPDVIAMYNGERVPDASTAGDGAAHWQLRRNTVEATALLRPWRLAETTVCGSRDDAVAVAAGVGRASGFRARLAAMRKTCEAAALADGMATADAPKGDGDDDKGEVRSLLQRGGAHLDGLTYVSVEFANPRDSAKAVSVLALVDTGSACCDLSEQLVRALGLPKAHSGGSSTFSTAAGTPLEAPLFRAALRVQGIETTVSVTAEPRSDEVDEEDVAFGLDSNSDEAVIGYEALAALGLAVDCRSRSLVRLPASLSSGANGCNGAPSQVNFLPDMRSPHVTLELARLGQTRVWKSVSALVDTGSTDVDLQKRIITELEFGDDDAEGFAHFETAGGITVQAPIFRAVARILGQERLVRVSPSSEESEDDSDESEDEEDSDDEEDEALLGHDALAALGVLVDCRGQRLVLPGASRGRESAFAESDVTFADSKCQNSTRGAKV